MVFILTCSRSGRSLRMACCRGLATGVIYLPASLIAGALWLLKLARAFLLAAGLAFSAMCVFALTRPDRLRQGALPH